MESLEERNLLAALLSSYLPDAIGPQAAAFGAAVAASEDFFVVAAPTTSTTTFREGEVFAYAADGSFVSRMQPPATVTTDEGFGEAVATDGDYVIVGAPRDNTLAGISGTAFLYSAQSGGNPSLTITQPSAAAGDAFGYSVAISGDLIVIGAPGEDTAGTDSGTIYIFSALLGSLLHTIPNPDAAAGASFGSAVAIVGNTIVAGAPHDNTGAAGAGRAYLIDASNGNLLDRLDNPTPDAGDQFGASVALSAGLAIVGTPFDDSSAADAGTAYLFDPVSGDFYTAINHPVPAVGDQFSGSLSLSGDLLVVGAKGFDASATDLNAGRAYLFQASMGTLLATLVNPTPAENEYFGQSLAISAAGIVTGSWGHDGLAVDSGEAYLFDATGNLTTTIASQPPAANEGFGNALALAGERFVVGHANDNTNGQASGKVAIYNRDTGLLEREFFAPNPARGDSFGSSVAVAGNRLAVGASGKSLSGADGGVVFVFDLTTGDLLQSILNPTPAASENFGAQLAFEGTTLVIGNPQDQEQAQGNGAVYLYDAATGLLTQTINNPSAAADERFGAAIAIAGDLIAIGAPGYSVSLANSGRMYVFSVATGLISQTYENPTPAVNDQFGYAVDLDGTNLLTSAPFDDTGAADSGRAYLYNATTANPPFTLTNNGVAPNDQFGVALALAGNKAVISAVGRGTGSGMIALVDLASRQLIETITGPSPNTGDAFGSAVVMDGNYFAIAAKNDGSVNYCMGAAYTYYQGSLTATLTSGTLTVTDVSANGTNNPLSVVRDGDDLLISDLNEEFASIPAGATLENRNRTLRVPLDLVTALAFNLGSGADTLTLDLTTGDVIPSGGLSVIGGGNGVGSDTLIINGGVQGAVAYSYESGTQGNVVLGAFGTISYTGLEVLRNTGEATTVAMNLAPTASTVSLGDDGTTGNGLLRISGVNIPQTFFSSPSDLLSFNPGNASDSITFNTMTDFSAGLIVGNDANRPASVTFIGLITPALDQSITAYALNTISTGGSGRLQVSGAGNVTLVSAKVISIGNSTSIVTVDGDVLLSANQQAIPNASVGKGIETYSGSVIEATGSGNVTLLGKGGQNGSGNNGITIAGTVRVAAGTLAVTGVGGGLTSGSNLGVSVSSSGAIIGGPNGTLEVIGSGGSLGSTFGDGNYGVSLVGLGRITSLGAHVVVTGTGGGGGSGDYGVSLATGGQIFAGGNGDTTVLGIGGQSRILGATGVALHGSGTRITSTAGNVRVEGRGGGTATTYNSYGVSLLSSATITAGGTGSVTVIGVGDYLNVTSGNSNHGVFLDFISQITSNNGPVSVTGTARGTGMQSTGVVVSSSAQITSGGLSPVTVAGFGASAGTGNAKGVHLAGGTITGGGPVRVEGSGGGSGNSNNNYGVSVTGGGRITGALASTTVTVVGLGNAANTSTGTLNHGVHVMDSASRITSAGGPVSVTGTGGGASGSGVYVGSFGEIIPGGGGSLTVEGFGSTASSTAGSNHGVYVFGSNARITSTSGPVLVRGTGGAGSPVGTANSAGIAVIDSGQILAGSTGTVTVEGRGSTHATATGNGNSGVRVTHGTITSSGGAILVRGWGGGIGSNSGFNFGVDVSNTSDSSSRILGTGSTPITVEGYGGNVSAASGNGNAGVRVGGSYSLITSTSGAIQITAVGGGSAASTGNDGLYLFGGTVSTAGPVTIHGTSGAGTSSSGIKAEAALARVSSSTSLMRYTGVATTNHATNFGISVNSGAVLGNGSGTLDLFADSMQLNSTASILMAASATVNLRTLTTGLPITLGGSDVPGVSLGLGSSEINSIVGPMGTGPAINIGDATAGPITFLGDVNRTTSANITLTTAADNNIALGNFGLNAFTAGNLTLTTSGTGAITTTDNLNNDLSGANITLLSGSGGIGSQTNTVRVNATGLTTTTGGSMYVTGTAGSTTINAPGFNVAGSGYLGGGTFVLGGTNRIPDTMPLYLGGNTTFRLNGISETVGSIAGDATAKLMNSHSTPAVVTMTATSGSYNLASVIGGSTANDNSLSLVKTGGATLTLGGNSTFTGTVNIQGGVLALAHGNSLGSSAAGTTIGLGATLDLNGTFISAEPLIVNGNGIDGAPSVVNNSANATAYYGPITLVGNGALGGSGNIEFSSITDGTSQFGWRKAGTGMVSLYGTQATDGPTTIAEGELRLFGPVVSPITAEPGTTLSGIGTINNQVIVRGGATVEPGAAGVGSLLVNRLGQPALTLEGGATLDLEFATNSSFDRLVVQGLVTLGSAGNYPTLNLTALGGFVPSVSGQLMIVSNDLTDPISGRFLAGAGMSVPAGTELTEGMVISPNFFGGYGAHISYVGGTGNDVVLNIVTSSIALVSGDLVITDHSTTGTNDNLTITRSGEDLLISDPTNLLVAQAGFTQVSPSTISIPFASITGNLQINTLLGDDSLTINLAGGNPLPPLGIAYNGGNPTTAAADKLFITGGAVGAVIANPLTASSGNLTLGSLGSVSYVNVEAVSQAGATTDLQMNLPGVTNALTFADDGTNGNGLLRMIATSLAPFTFASPSNSLVLNRGAATDTLTIQALPDFSANLTIGSAIAPFSTIAFSGSATLAANHSLSAHATGTISFASSADWLLSGTGSAALTTARNISFGSGTTLSVVHGDLTLSANQQTTPTAGNYTGIEVNNGTVHSSGTGQVTVSGRGGTGGEGTFSTVGAQHGVMIYGGGVIRGGVSGTLRVTGTGGASLWDENVGVKLGTTSGNITTLGAHVEVIGQGGGGGNGSDLGRGIDLDAAPLSVAQISATGSGTVTVRGTGSAYGSYSQGVRVKGASGLITSAGGEVQVIGLGGLGQGTSTHTSGVYIEGGTISASAGADLLIQGTGGLRGDYQTHGVHLYSTGSTSTGMGFINSNGGNTRIIGTTQDSDFETTGVNLGSLSTLTVGSAGSLLIQGTSTPGIQNTGSNNDGVRLSGRISSAGANVTVKGSGGFGGASNGIQFGPEQFNAAATTELYIEATAANSGHYGLSWSTGSQFSVPTNGIVTIVTDSIDATSTAPLNVGTGTVNFRTLTPGSPIILGQYPATNSLNLRDSFLDQVRGAVINIGTPESGMLAIQESITRPGPGAGTINLVSGGKILFSSYIDTLGNPLTLTSGPDGIEASPHTQETYVGSVAPNHLTFGAGSRLVFNYVQPFGNFSSLRFDHWGAIDITGLDLVVSGTVTPYDFETQVLIGNDGVDPIIGTFNGLPEGSIVNVNGVLRRLTYVGGTGNDVELVRNYAPTIANPGTRTVNEDSGSTLVSLTGISAGPNESQAVQITAVSSHPAIVPHPTISYSSPATTGTLTFTPEPNQHGNVTITLTVRDPGFDNLLNTADDLVISPSFNINVVSVNDEPSFVKGPDIVLQDHFLMQSFPNWATALSTGPTDEIATQYLDILTASVSNPGLFNLQPSFGFAGALYFNLKPEAYGTSTVTIYARDSGGTANGGVNVSPSQTFTITVLPPSTLRVSVIAPASGGLTLNFNRVLEPSMLNLYDTQGGGLGPADFVLHGETVGNVRGSIVLDPGLRSMTFIPTTGIIQPDTYTVTLRSATDGFRDSNHELLDGDGDLIPGGDWVTTWTTGSPAPNSVLVQIPNFSRGPQQAVNVPASSASGIPISFSDGEGVTTATFQIHYDPTLLNITAATVAPGLPEGATVDIETSSAGVAIIAFASPTPLPAGTKRFIDLQADVPTTAPYRDKHILNLENVSINSGAIPSIGDDGLHVVAYFGDVSGNGTYSAQDASLIARQAVGIDTGLELYQLLDPTIVGDLTGNGGFSSSDTSYMLQAAVGIPVAEIPAPLPTVSLLFGGPDPKLSIPRNLSAEPGQSLEIPVDIDSIENLTGNGLTSADLVLYFDPQVLDVTSVSLGTMVANRGWMIAPRIDPIAGRVDLSLAGMRPLEGKFIGELVKLHATVKANAPAGASAINLAASSRSRATQLNEGFLTLIPAPTDSANDPIDGLLTIASTPANVTEPTARLVDDRLLITGTAENDRIIVSGASGDQIRVRAGQRVLGTFTADGIAIDGRGGNDYIYVAPELPATVIHQDSASHERADIFAGDNISLADATPQNLDAPVASSGTQAHAASAALSAQDLALLQLLANWQDDFHESSTAGRTSRVSPVRRR